MSFSSKYSTHTGSLTVMLNSKVERQYRKHKGTKYNLTVLIIFLLLMLKL